GAADRARDDLELVPLGNRGLVDVPGEDQLGSRVDERREHVTAARDGLLPRAPRRADQVVVEDDDSQRPRRRAAEKLLGAAQLTRADAAGLVAPGTHRVEADDEELVRLEDRLRGLPVPLELAERAREAGGERIRDVVVAGNREHGRAEAAQERGRAVVLLASAAVREVAAG